MDVQSLAGARSGYDQAISAFLLQEDLSRKSFDYYSRGMIAIVGTWTIAFFFTVLFECGTKFEYLWSTLLNLLTHCTNDLMYLKAYAISDVITDGLILATPIPIVCRILLQ